MEIKRESGRRIYIFRAKLVLPGVLASLPLEEVSALRGVKIIGRRGMFLHWNEKSWGEKKEAIVQVSDSLPCCWRETSLFSDLEPEERPAPQQHLIFTALLLCRASLPDPAWPGRDRAQLSHKMLPNLCRCVCILGVGSGKGCDTSRWQIQHSPRERFQLCECILLYPGINFVCRWGTVSEVCSC